MLKRGRPSAGDITAAKAVKDVVSSVVPGGFGKRIDPPEDMKVAEQIAIWREIVDSEPADFFATAATKGLLRDYCRHRATCDQVSKIIELFEGEWLKSKDGVKRYSELCKVRDMEARAAGDKAVKLRLTNQARWQPAGAARAAAKVLQGPKPWDA